MAGRQHGVVSMRQLRGELGFSEGAVAHAAASGRLHRLHRGVYAVGHTTLSLRGRCLAAVLACGEEALLSHRSAAWLWEISPRSPLPPSVTTPIPRKEHTQIVRHHSRVLGADDRAQIDGIPVTALPRTLLDLASGVPRGQLDRCVERAEERQLFDLAAVDSLLARTVGHQGHGRLRRAIAMYREPGFTRSELERRFLELASRAGLPRPSTAFNVAGHELDVYWPRERLAVELDTYETHGSHAAFERDRERDEDLALAGILTTRVTAARLEREPRRVVERIARLLRERGG